jgi:hypothetical protein
MAIPISGAASQPSPTGNAGTERSAAVSEGIGAALTGMNATAKRSRLSRLRRAVGWIPNPPARQAGAVQDGGTREWDLTLNVKAS